ncbi:transmembrane protein 267 [Trichogramma pretiosum]|uniref:transmembrane protein 267 n=1 Tax=Trichogramma pretiosum TaxID=7493 RepID=UPI0006C9550C|nr:transmembrane protein 267 [Trichogramma pretiosum]
MMSIIKQGLLLRLFFTSVIAFVSFLGDLGLHYGKTEIVRAISDNLTHAIVGGATWALILVLFKKSVIENIENVIICFFMSSFIDIDHFIAASSWDINDATHLRHRPFLHCTTIPIFLWGLMSFLYKITHASKWITYGTMILASFLSHHVRDGNRRGLWFWPFGSTQPIPYYLYIVICILLPYTLQLLMSWQLSKDDDITSSINVV